MKAHRLLDLDRRDLPKLRALSAVFVLASASTVMLASLSKALFLSTMPITLLPWMFLGSAALTVVSSLLTVVAMRRLSLRARFSGLLVVAVSSFLALRLAYPHATGTVGVVLLLWGPAVGHLTVLHAWSVPTALLPTRQAKRLVPVLAAVTTVGAVVGGLLVQGLLTFTTTENLLVCVAALLLVVLLRLSTLFRTLEADDDSVPARAEPVRPGRRGALRQAYRTISAHPLLRDVALVVFLLQAASLIIDYQLSAELQPQFDKDGIASFLGGFYWISNLVVVVVTLTVTGPLLRLTGLGLAVATSAVVIGLGSIAYVAAQVGAWGSTFWIIAGTAFAERIAQYGFTKPAMQMVYMPLAGRGGEHAKTMIDGVVHRSATLVVSALLILAAPQLATQFRLSPPTIIACLVVVHFAWRLTAHYRRAIFEALSAGHLDPALTPYLRQGLGRGTRRALERQLASDDEEEIITALDVARDLELPVTRERWLALLADDRARVSASALRGLLDDGPVAHRVLASALSVDRPAPVLRALIDTLGDHADAGLLEVLRPLTRHRDPRVATAACILRIRAAGNAAESQLSEEIRSGEAASEGPRLTGMTRARDFARDLPDLLDHPDPEIRRDTVRQMGTLGLACFVEPLIACLADDALRDHATTALVRHGDRVASAARANLSDPNLPLSARLALLRVLARVATIEALEVMVDACRDEHLRDAAVGALWQLAADDTAPVADPATLRDRVAEAITELESYAAVEAKLAMRLSPRHRLFVREIDRAILRTEERALRLAGLLSDRDAVYRAFLHYRSGDPKTRSNAIELLEQTVKDDTTRKLIRLVERTENDEGALRPSSIAIQTVVASASVDGLVGQCGPWIERLWRWCEARASAPLDWEDDLDRVALLAGVSPLSAVEARSLQRIAETAERLAVDEGEVIYRRGDEERGVHLLLEGSVHLTRDGVPIATIDSREVFGEVSWVDGGARPITAVAAAPSVLARLGAAALDELVATEPAILRALVRTLARRLNRSVRAPEARS